LPAASGRVGRDRAPAAPLRGGPAWLPGGLGNDVAMILEHAVLDVREGSSADFEAAFAKAKSIIAASPGFRSLRLERCMEQPDRYVLLVEWDSVEAHEDGFRRSPPFEEWRTLLHGFYPTRPTVQHFETAFEA
jgi:heme-degrading monooxygenase HmoA